MFFILSFLFIISYNNFIKAENNDINVKILRVDGKDILTDSTNKPFYFYASSPYEIVYMEYLHPYETVWEEYTSDMIIDETWVNGKYTFKAYDEYGNVNQCHIYYDTVKPVGKLYSLNQEHPNGSNIESEFIYFEVTDELSGLDMVYVKKPNSNYYTEYLRNTYLYEAGTYYFYATDYAGNVSITYSITLNSEPMVDIIYNDENNSIYLTWTRSDYIVYVNDNSYVKEKVFYDEGIYDVLVVDGNGRRGEETFIIDHLYKYVKTIQPTCSKEGYLLYKCITCNQEKEEINKDKIPHELTVEEFSATCTENGYQLKSCNMCDYEEKIVTSNPIGHILKEERINATCTVDGGLVKRCINCSYIEYLERIEAKGHLYKSEIIKDVSCIEDGIKLFTCINCSDSYQDIIDKLGHNYIMIDEKIIKDQNGETKEITTKCHNCGDIKKEYLELVKSENSSIKNILFRNSSYLIIILISLSGLWSIYMGLKFITARKRSEVIQAKKYILNYIIGLIVIFCIIMITPFLIEGIKAIL